MGPVGHSLTGITGKKCLWHRALMVCAYSRAGSALEEVTGVGMDRLTKGMLRCTGSRLLGSRTSVDTLGYH